MHSLLFEEETKAKLIDKIHLKREAYKVFGMPADDLLRERDQNIYNDFDFYQILLKDFLTSNEGEEGTQAANDAEDD